MFSGQDDKRDKKGAKQSLNVKSGAERRQRQLSTLRHKTHEECMKHLRSEHDEPITNDPLVDSTDVWAYDAKTPPNAVPVALLPRFVQMVMEGQTSQDVFHGTLMIRKLLSVEKNPPYDAVTQSGVVPRIVELLDQTQFPEMQFEAAWALTNIAAGTSENTLLLVRCDAIPRFVALLSSPNADCRDQGAWAIGNLAGEGAGCRDEALRCGAMPALLNLLAVPDQPMQVIRNATWAVSNLCRSRPYPELDKVRIALPMLSMHLNHHDEQLVSEAAWGISYISDGDAVRVQAVLESGVLPRIVELLSVPAASLNTPAIRTIGNIATGHDEQTQMIIDAGALPPMCVLLTHAKRAIRKETCWTVSNIAAGKIEQIEALVKTNIFIPVLSCLAAPELDVRKEAVWAIANVATCGTAEHVKYLLNIGTIPALCDTLRTYDDKIVVIALEALQCFLQTGQDDFLAGIVTTNVVVQQVMACGGVDHLEKLQNHTNTEVYHLTLRILESYFNVDDDIGPAVMDDNIDFTGGAADQGMQANGFHF